MTIYQLLLILVAGKHLQYPIINQIVFFYLEDVIDRNLNFYILAKFTFSIWSCFCFNIPLNRSFYKRLSSSGSKVVLNNY